MLKMPDNESRIFLYRRLRNFGIKNKICAEIGVWLGDNAKEILDVLKPSKLYLIDPWEFYPEYQRKRGISGTNQNKMNKTYEYVKNRFMNEDKVIIIREKSENAASMFQDNYIDFLYIDGNHKKEFVERDLKLYYPKIKKNGYIAGDDYVPKTHPRELKKGLREAVDEFINTHKVNVILRGENRFQFLLEKLDE